MNILYGNGIDDDFPAIQEMLDSGKSVVTLPAPEKHYVIGKTLKIHSDQELKTGRYTRIVLKDGANCAMLENADFDGGNKNVCVDGGIWDMNHNRQKPNPYHFPDPDTGEKFEDAVKRLGFDKTTSKTLIRGCYMDEAEKAQVDRYADKYQIADRVLWTENEGVWTSPQFVVGESKVLSFNVDATGAEVSVVFADGTQSIVKSYAAEENAKIELGAYAGKLAVVTMTAGATNAVIDDYVMPMLGAVDFAAEDYSVTLNKGTGFVSVEPTDKYDNVLQLLNGQDELYTKTELRFNDNFLTQINNGDIVKFSFRILPNTSDNTVYKFRSTRLSDPNKHYDSCYSDNWGVTALPTNVWREITLTAEETRNLVSDRGIRVYAELHGENITNHEYIIQWKGTGIRRSRSTCFPQEKGLCSMTSRTGLRIPRCAESRMLMKLWI